MSSMSRLARGSRGGGGNGRGSFQCGNVSMKPIETDRVSRQTHDFETFISKVEFPVKLTINRSNIWISFLVSSLTGLKCGIFGFSVVQTPAGHVILLDQLALIFFPFGAQLVLLLGQSDLSEKKIKIGKKNELDTGTERRKIVGVNKNKYIERRLAGNWLQ